MPSQKLWKHLPLGIRIKMARTDAGYSQERLASEIGVGWRTIIRWEKGESTPSPEHRGQLARILQREDEMFVVKTTDDGDSSPDQFFVTRDEYDREVGKLRGQVEELLDALGHLMDARGLHRTERERLRRRLTAADATS